MLTNHRTCHPHHRFTVPRPQGGGHVNWYNLLRASITRQKEGSNGQADRYFQVIPA